MINSKTLKKILLSNLNTEEYIILYHVNNDTAKGFFNDEFYKDYIENLMNHDYITTTGFLTTKGKDYINDNTVMITRDEGDFSSMWLNLQNKLVELTGSKQKKLQGKYPFFPNDRDFVSRITVVSKKYGMYDKKRIENVLIKYIEKCASVRFEMVSQLDYYIYKNGTSKLYTDYIDFDLEEEEEEIEDNTLNI